MNKADLLLQTAEKLEQIPARARVLAGFDGFVDEIIHAVDTREDFNHYQRIEHIADFGKRISDAAGLSCNIELVPQHIKLGGNGPIQANALISQGYEVHYIGAIGYDEPHHVFREFAAKCASVISLAEPALTDAIEFHDGKVMLGQMEFLKDVTWEHLLKLRTEFELKTLLEGVGLIAFNNWTMVPFLNSFFAGFYEMLPEVPHPPKMFVDLTDPAKRGAEDIIEALALISRLQERGQTVLGMNLNESVQIAKIVLGSEVDDLTERARRLREKLELHMVMIHPTVSACVATAEGEFFQEGPYCEKPVLTTGAGDNFNAGFCTGFIEDLAPDECLISGVCASGFYVRNARSASREELVGFMRTWAEAGAEGYPDQS